MGSAGFPSESEKQKLTLCLIAAVERRVSHVCMFYLDFLKTIEMLDF